MSIKMSKASKARKEKLGRGFGSIPVAQRNAYAKQYHAPGARTVRALGCWFDFMLSRVRLALATQSILFNKYIQNMKKNPDGSYSYELRLLYPPKQFFGEYILEKDILQKEPEDKNELP
jgi:hypothetical protein